MQCEYEVRFNMLFRLRWRLDGHDMFISTAVCAEAEALVKRMEIVLNEMMVEA